RRVESPFLLVQPTMDRVKGVCMIQRESISGRVLHAMQATSASFAPKLASLSRRVFLHLMCLAGSGSMFKAKAQAICEGALVWSPCTPADCCYGRNCGGFCHNIDNT